MKYFEFQRGDDKIIEPYEEGSEPTEPGGLLYDNLGDPPWVCLQEVRYVDYEDWQQEVKVS